MQTVLVATLFGLSLHACGDGVFFISFRSGTVAGDPTCNGGTGNFALQDQGGLLLGVVIGSDTTITTAAGQPGSCADLAPGASVNVTGSQRGNTITAQTIHLQ